MTNELEFDAAVERISRAIRQVFVEYNDSLIQVVPPLSAAIIELWSAHNHMVETAGGIMEKPNETPELTLLKPAQED